MASSIADYATIGDGRTCALVSKAGSIDFLCWPRFDSGACFAALLGDDGNGYWRMSPAGYVTETKRRYRENTSILETEHSTETGRVRITDFMPWHNGPSAVVRIVEGIEGELPMAMSLRVRFGYGQISPWMQRHNRGMTFELGPDRLTLDCPIELGTNVDDVDVRFTVFEGSKHSFVLTCSSSIARAPPPVDTAALLRVTEKQWKNWTRRFKPRGPWDALIQRSLITLRTLIDRESGGIVAAATFGLPEIPGGPANWDYRYCWLRDSTFTLTALLNAGFHEEATRWREWILRSIGGQPDAMQIVYRIDGSRDLTECEMNGLAGYQGASPVLVGNAASEQMQLDVYGELMDSFNVLAKAGIERTKRVVEVETAIVRHLEKVWDKPSFDIWERRGETHCYTYSQAMAWVGITRFLAAHTDDEAMDRVLIGRLKQLAETVHRTVCERGYSSELGYFVPHEGSTSLDASLLLLPLVDFLPVEDPRITATIAAIERDLVEGGLVRRFPRKSDGDDEGAFLACSCWLADCYKMQGRDEEAAVLLKRVVGLANDVGLLSEEYDVANRTLIGNIPQALTHLGVINTALFLSRPVIQRGGK